MFMQPLLSVLVKENQTIAIATSGGSDSMALLHYTFANRKKLHINVIAINVEHGIRGESSLSDTNFVKDYCQKLSIPCLFYKVDALKTAKEKKLSVEQSARLLRYQCFFDAINSGKCDMVATAHHQRDNAESVLFNLFRGTGIKGAKGIDLNYQDKIIRPLVNVSKEEIDEYVKQNDIPYVTDQTNFCTDYTRNDIRINLLPKIKQTFPEVEKSLSRFAHIMSETDDYISQQADKIITVNADHVKISLPVHKAIFATALIKALNHLGVKKDWESAHVDFAYSLTKKENGARANLLDFVTAIKEYDGLVLYKEKEKTHSALPFTLGKIEFCESVVSILPVEDPDLKDGLYGDLNKIPETAVIRKRLDGDLFTKFGGGSKSLGDYLTDKKVPLRVRDNLILLADGKEVLVIFGLAISQKIKVEQSTKNIIKFTKEEDYGLI